MSIQALVLAAESAEVCSGLGHARRMLGDHPYLETLRRQVLRSLERIPDVGMDSCHSAAMAIDRLQEDQPDLIILVGGGKSNLGLEALAALDYFGLRLPIITIAAPRQIPAPEQFAKRDILVVESPVLDSTLMETLEVAMAGRAAHHRRPPYTVRDYLLMAGLEGSSVRLQLSLGDGAGEARLEVFEGEVYSASFEDLEGLEAVVAVLWQAVVGARFCSVKRRPGYRYVQQPWQQLLWPTSNVKQQVQAFDDQIELPASYRTQAMEAISLFEDLDSLDSFQESLSA